jgi:uncharacterized membrane protein
MFGLLMAFATVFLIPFNVEPYCWLVIFIICAYSIAKRASGKYFLHGFCTSLVNCVWITAAHILLFSQYAVTHTQEMSNSNNMSFLHGHPRQQMLVFGPIIGIASGIVLGLFALIASKIVKK